MNYTTLMKNALWVGGGMFLGEVVNSQIIKPNLSNVDVNPTLKSLLGPGLVVGGAFLAQDMLPKKVLYGAIGMAGYNVVGGFMGQIGAPQQQQEQQQKPAA